MIREFEFFQFKDFSGTLGYVGWLSGENRPLFSWVTAAERCACLVSGRGGGSWLRPAV